MGSGLHKVISLIKLANDLSRKEFRLKYHGSFFGVTWAFVHPVIVISILWFVFSIGFKSVPVENVPFILWLIAGMIPWFFISEVISSGVSAISENSYLVKKVVFKIELLPVVKVITALKIHLFFVGIFFIIYFLYGYKLDIHNIQLLYYLICAVLLTAGMNYITSSLNVFFKDTGQIIAIIVQFGFWVTPIFWMLDMVPEKYHFLIKLNPVFYIIDGYRISMFRQEWVTDHPYMTVYFWFITLIILMVGFLLFKKLKPHFADVL